MSNEILVGLIAGIVAVLVSVLTAYFTRRHYEIRFKKEVREKYNEKLIEHRLNEYPRVFEISGKLGEPGNGKRAPEEYLPIIYDLRAWWAGPGALLLSEESIKAFYKVYRYTRKIGRSSSEISDDQFKKMMDLNQAFRSTLRKDVHSLFSESEPNRFEPEEDDYELN